MSGPRLGVTSRHAYGHWYIAWFDEGDEGGELNPHDARSADEAVRRWRENTSDDSLLADAEHKTACRAILDMKDPNREALAVDSHKAFEWESEKRAHAAMRVARVAIKMLREKTPWPEWAKTALANGWKAPKGWKP